MKKPILSAAAAAALLMLTPVSSKSAPVKTYSLENCKYQPLTVKKARDAAREQPGMSLMNLLNHGGQTVGFVRVLDRRGSPAQFVDLFLCTNFSPDYFYASGMAEKPINWVPQNANATRNVTLVYNDEGTTRISTRVASRTAKTLGIEVSFQAKNIGDTGHLLKDRFYLYLPKNWLR